ncbi:hypothetical protein B0H13DRAFT_1910319 [Mycena leptocephala]|nr:hypothetical protein B0H13DRAFT_1910319 [Mycena leptocephala]
MAIPLLSVSLLATSTYIFPTSTLSSSRPTLNTLISGDDIPDLMPVFYNIFAQETNKHDNSDHFWVYLSDGKIVWKEGALPPTANAYCVYDQDILECPMLGVNEVTVTRDYFDNAQHLVELERRRELKYYRLRLDKKAGVSHSVIDTTSKDVMEGFTKKRKALEAAAEEATAKKQKADDGAGPSGAAATGGDSNMG